MGLIAAIWFVVAAAFGLAALRSASVGPAPTAVAALLAAVSALLGVGLVASVFLFLVIALIGQWVVRPVVRASQAEAARLRPGTESLVGRDAVVVESISNSEAVGCVRIDGELWSARTIDDEATIPLGEAVKVVEVRGPLVVVSD